VCGWVNLRSHLAISFNSKPNWCVWSYYDGWPTQMQDGLILMGDLPKCKMVSLWWVTYPSGEKGRVVSFLWVTYPGEEWPHYNGWPTQVKKDGEWSHSNRWPTQVERGKNGLILMGDLPKWKGGRVVSFLWVTYPGERMVSL